MLARTLCVAVLLLAFVRPAAAQEDAVAAVLDALHEAASTSDAQRYWGLFAEDAIFFGTDPTERWTIEDFHGYADPAFESGRGWTYHVLERNVFLAPGGRMAWFDESLHNANYGNCRGTGVLVRRDDAWKIIQYNLSIPVPNDLAATVVAMIRDAE